MASLQLVSDTYYICFRFAGRRFKRSLKTDRVDRADARRVRLEETLRLVETGRIEIPNDTEDVVEFLLADGKPKRRKPLPRPVKTTPPPPFTLLFPEASSCSLDFHALGRRGEETDLENHYQPMRGQAGPSVLAFFAMEQKSRHFSLIASIVSGFSGDCRLGFLAFHPVLEL